MFVVVQTNVQPWQGGRDLETRGKLKEKKKQRVQVYINSPLSLFSFKLQLKHLSFFVLYLDSFKFIYI